MVLGEDSDFAAISKQDLSTGIHQLDYEASTDGLVLGKEEIEVQKKGAKLLLTFESEGKGETYLQIQGLSIDKKDIDMQIIHVKGEDERHKNINVRSKYINSYFGKVNFLANTGYSRAKKSWITLTFPETATYRYKTIKIFHVDMLHYKNRMKELRQETLTNIRTDNNRIQGELELDSNGILFLSIPYSKGWKAYVDGQERKLVRGNIMYMALPVTEGKHQIRLQYRTPYLLEGAILSAISLLYLFGRLLYERERGTHA